MREINLYTMFIFRTFGFIATLASTFFPFLPNPALSTPVLTNEPTCYMKKADSTIVDLTRLCNKPLVAPNTRSLTKGLSNFTVPVATPNTKRTTGDFGNFRATPNTPVKARSERAVTNHNSSSATTSNTPVDAVSLPVVKP